MTVKRIKEIAVDVKISKSASDPTGTAGRRRTTTTVVVRIYVFFSFCVYFSHQSITQL